MDAIDKDRFDVIPIGITKKGTWVRGSFHPAEGDDVNDYEVPEGTPLTIRPDTGDLTDGHDIITADVFFPLLHGPFGEDGTIQGLFEIIGKPYVGSGVLASAASMDKHYTKIILQEAGLPVAPWVLATESTWAHHKSQILEDASQLSFPLFVKPSRAGSSLGVSKVSDPRDLEDAIEKARVHDPRVIIEAGIAGREVECAVLGGRGTEDARASSVGEIILTSDVEFYDYDAKYVDTDGLVLDIPARLPDEDRDRIRQMAVDAFRAVDCEGMARVDFFYCDGQLTINEINTIPGFTPFSMYPLLWQDASVGYAELIDELIHLALEAGTGLR